MPTFDPSQFINKNPVEKKVEEAYVAKHKFTEFGLDKKLAYTITSNGMTTPTPIQDQIIPVILDGKDVIGLAETGTGKTAAFLIPLINKTLKEYGRQTLILAPTRELAIQIEEELRKLAVGFKLFSTICVGGTSIRAQIQGLRRKNHFIIGTPGRVLDLIDRGNIRPQNIRTVVLDEADRMLDMGFIADMRTIMAGMPKDRHTLFFSATLSNDIEKIIKDFLREPVRISVKTQDTSKNVDQDVVRVERGSDKVSVLKGLLDQKDFSKVIIFGRTKHGVERISRDLIQLGFKAESIHGDKNHGQRQRALKLFKENNLQVLVATDVAARGLDIPNVTHVINYDVPATYDDYSHRIGRTGRGGKKGKALTFVD